ncbi:ABC transporter ATP-binding protein [Desulfoplanes formicivorans]|nr:ATP-binding cassette domain-containing protein [Desulfoplanes formicivorans]
METGAQAWVEVVLRDLDVHLGGIPVLRDVNWHLRQGEHWAVLGGNGAGKSTLLKLVHGMLWPRQFKGERVYLLNGKTRISPVAMRRLVSLVSCEMQDLYWKRSWNLPVRTVVETGYFDTPFVYEPLSRAQKDHCLEVCERFGIAHLASRGMLQLSTGEAKRVLLARAMVKNPRLLLLDECCLGLDPQSRKDFLGMVDMIAAQDHLHVVATSHRHEELPRCITHVAAIKAGTIHGITRKKPCLPEVPSSGSAGISLSSCSPLMQVPVRAPGEGVLIRIANATVRLHGRDILHHISWTMTSAQDWAIVGPNGAGKTTLLKLIYGAVYPLAGGQVERLFAGDADNVRAMRRYMGFVSCAQQTEYPENATGRQVLLSGFYSSQGMHETPTRHEMDRCNEVAACLNITTLLDRMVQSLSYGQMRKLLIARAMIHSPGILLLDEPFAGVEAGWREEIRHLLMICRNQGTRIILVTHHLDQLEGLVSHELVLDQGRIVRCGPLNQRGS